MKKLLVPTLAVGLAALAVPALSSVAADAATSVPSVGLFDTEGAYVATTPTRVFDSRTTLKRQLRAGESVSVPVLGRGGVPSTGVSAVVVNLTAAKAASSGYLTAYPSTGSTGGTSNVVFAAGESRASLVTVPVGSDGAIKVLDGAGTGAGPVDAVVDVQGYYQAASADSEVEGASYDQRDEPYRLLDTRTSGGALKPNSSLTVTITPDAGDETIQQPTALAVNLTAVSPTAPGYLTAWDGTSARPATSNVNFAKGQTTPNNAVVPLTQNQTGGTTSFGVFNGGSSTTQVVVDVMGAYYSGPFGLRFVPLSTPQRIVDSRAGKGADKLGQGATATVQAPSSVLSSSTDQSAGPTQALVGSLTAVRPSASTHLTAYAADAEERPAVSNLNPVTGQTVANHLVVGLSQDTDSFDLYNFLGSTDVIVDVTGRFEQPTFTFPTDGPTLTAQKAEQEQGREHARLSVVKLNRSAG